MSQSEPRVVTGLMLGAFLALGVDTLVIVAALWYVGELPGTTARAVAVGVVAVFTLWVVSRWLRLRLARRSEVRSEQTTDAETQDPLDRLKQQYADGDLSETEFEERLDTLLDADSRAEAVNRSDTRRTERSPESE